MRTKLFILPTLIALLGCKSIGLGDDPGVGKACTLIGSATVIRARVTSATPLPANIAVSLNGHDVDADECVNNGPFFDSVEVSDDRTQADVIFHLDSNPDDFEFYFPINSTEPQSNLMSLGFFSRATCGDTHVEFDEVNDTQISWAPVYANGEDCGSTSHTADVEVQTH